MNILFPVLFFALVAAASLPQAAAWAGEAAKPEAQPDPYGTLVKPALDNAPSRTEVVSAQAVQVGVDESVLGDTIAMTLPLLDENGDTVTLSGLSGGRPVVLQLGYYRCPVICSQVLGNLTKWADATPQLRAGIDYEVVSVSIDPKETAVNAKEARARVMKGADAARGTGWHFLTASPASIQGMTQACGFRYLHIPSNDQYAHPGLLVFLSPQGKVTRLLNVNGGIADSGADVDAWRQAVAGAAAGTVTKPAGPTLFAQCTTLVRNALVVFAKNALQAAVLVTIAVMLALFFYLRRLESRKRAASG